MPITSTEFAEALISLRPVLTKTAQAWSGGTHDDAEDLVSETVLYAVNLLDKYSDTGIENGLLRWLYGILRHVLSQDRRTTRRRPATVPIDQLSEFGPNRPIDHIPGSSAPSLANLPPADRALVQDWLDGYNQGEIAKRRSMHRTTVKLHLERAFKRLGRRLPEEAESTPESRTASLRGAGNMRGPSIYHKPHGAWPDWMSQHPPDIIYSIYPDTIRWTTLRAFRFTQRMQTARHAAAARSTHQTIGRRRR